MTDNRTVADNKPKEPKLPFDANHPFHPDYKGANPGGAEHNSERVEPQIAPIVLISDAHSIEKELHAHDHGSVNLEQSHLAEQQWQTQQKEQNNREVFPKGLAQEHSKGRG